jgi:tetratricopeptide (TPR) repeat protein
MTRFVFRAAMACAMTLTSLVISAPAQADWLEARSKHFIVYGDMSEADLRNRTERLERFDALLRTLFSVEDSARVSVFILPTIGDVQDLAHNRDIGGFYNASAQLAYGFVPARLNFDVQGLSAEAISMHEYTHHILLSGVDRFVPGWATEGLAEFFMTAKLNDDGSITVGAPNPSRTRAMFAQSHWTVEDLLTSDDRKISRDEEIEKYSRGWAMIHYLWMSGKRPGQYVKFIKLLNENGDALAAGKEAFGDLDKLDQEINAYLRRSGFPSSRFSAEQLHTPADVAIRRLSAGEEAILPYRMQSLLGVDEDTAPKLANRARPVAAGYPNDAFVQRSLAEMEYDARQYDAADAAADRALAADPKNLMAMAYKGRVAAQRARKSQSAADWQVARNWFLKANQVDPNHPLPFELYYDSFSAAGETPPADAVSGLFRATVVMPQDSGLRARAAAELIRAGNVKRARTVLAPVAFNPHASQDNPARKAIEKIDAGASAKDLLAYLDGEKFLLKLNDFTGPDLAKEEQDKDKGKNKDTGKDTGKDS